MEKERNLGIVIVLALLILLLIFSLIIFNNGGRFIDDLAIGTISGMAINDTNDTVENTTVDTVENITTDTEEDTTVDEGEDYSGLELSVVVPGKYKDVSPGDTLQFQIVLKNLDKSGRYDIHLDYYIKKNDVILENRREVKAIETQASFLSSIEVPDTILPGRYNIVVGIDGEKEAIDTFYIKSSELNQIKIYLIILTVAILIVGVLISFELRKLGKRKRLT